jgi:hypothetical protein
MRKRTVGHALVYAAEKLAVKLGHNPRGDGLQFQTRSFYEQEFERHGLQRDESAGDAGLGSNMLQVWVKCMVPSPGTPGEG